MKRALIVASVGVLASTVWAASANAQGNINPNLYPNNASERYGAQPFPAGGPVRSGNRCRTEVDATRGYGFMKDCPAPKGCCIRQSADAVSSCSGPDAKAQAGIAVIQTRAV
jgi:hypothetical protein